MHEKISSKDLRYIPDFNVNFRSLDDGIYTVKDDVISTICVVIETLENGMRQYRFINAIIEN